MFVAICYYFLLTLLLSLDLLRETGRQEKEWQRDRPAQELEGLLGHCLHTCSARLVSAGPSPRETGVRDRT